MLTLPRVCHTCPESWPVLNVYQDLSSLNLEPYQVSRIAFESSNSTQNSDSQSYLDSPKIFKSQVSQRLGFSFQVKLTMRSRYLTWAILQVTVRRPTKSFIHNKTNYAYKDEHSMNCKNLSCLSHMILSQSSLHWISLSKPLIHFSKALHKRQDTPHSSRPSAAETFHNPPWLSVSTLPL